MPVIPDVWWAKNGESQFGSQSKELGKTLLRNRKIKRVGGLELSTFPKFHSQYLRPKPDSWWEDGY